MAIGYQRQSSANIVDGNIIYASFLNAEFNKLESAFDNINGHNHDGTTAGGAPVPILQTTGTLTISRGGSGATTASAARTNLGVAIGSDVQAWDNDLDDIAALNHSDGLIIVSDGTNWVTEGGATARNSLGLGSMAIQNQSSVSITGGSIAGITDLTVADGGTGASTVAGARSNLDAAHASGTETGFNKVGSGSAYLESGDIIWGDGQHRMTDNDGGGNANIRFGHYYSGTPKTKQAGGGGVHIKADVDNKDGSFRLTTLSAGTNVDDTIAVGPELYGAYSGTFTWNSHEIWHAGNDGPGSGLNADLLDGLDNTYFAHRDNNLSDLVNASTARSNLGLGSVATQNSSNVSVTGGSITGITDIAVADGGTGASTASGARTNLSVYSKAETDTIGNNAKAYADGLVDDLSGVSNQSASRTNLGLGTVATQDASNVNLTGGSVSGITDLAIADGGTGASTASGARSNLGLGNVTNDAQLKQASNLLDVVSKSSARSNLGLGTAATRDTGTLAGNVPTNADFLREDGVLAPHTNLKLDANRISADAIVVAPDEVRVQADGIRVTDASGGMASLFSVDVTADVVNSGANGLDTGSEAASTWYYTWVIYNGTTTAALLSTSSTFSGLTLPSGYTHAGLVGAVYNDGSSDFIEMGQVNQLASISVFIDAGSQGNITSYTAFAMTVPENASKWHGNMYFDISGNRRVFAASTESGAGERTFNPMTGSAGNIGVWVEVPLIETQTVYFKTNSNDSDIREITTSGWEF